MKVIEHQANGRCFRLYEILARTGEISIEKSDSSDDSLDLTYVLENLDEESGFCGEWESHTITLDPKETFVMVGKGDEIDGEQCKELLDHRSFIDSGPHGMGNMTYYRVYPKPLEESTEFNRWHAFNSLLAMHRLTKETTLIIEKTS